MYVYIFSTPQRNPQFFVCFPDPIRARINKEHLFVKSTTLRPLAEWRVVFKNSQHVHQAMKHPMTSNETSDGKRPPRSAVATGGVFSPAPARRLSLLGCIGWAGAAPKPQGGSINGDVTTELLSEVVTWLVLVCVRGKEG